MHVPSVTGLKRMVSLAETWPIFQSSVLVMVAGHTKPPRLGPSNMSATGMSPDQGYTPSFRDTDTAAALNPKGAQAHCDPADRPL